MNYYLFIPFFIIIIFFLPIKLEVRLSFNVLNFSGVVGVFLYSKKILHQQFWIKGKKIITQNEDGIETKEMDFSSKEIIFIETLTDEIKDKTRLKQMTVLYNIGVGDAFLSSIVAGLVNFVITSFFTNIKNQKPTATLSLNDTVSYNREVCQFALTLTLTISLFDILYSFFRSVVLARKKKADMQKEMEEDEKTTAKERAC